MKRTALLRHLRKQGCRLAREGAKHSLYFNPAQKRYSTIPRHAEIDDKLAKKICRDLGAPEIGKS
ncbi:MAG: type II toxin-antitoxin system HicA family toxin [Myxococcales bacterium]|nr:MAG: type II toxin-antitoxin system HicA family toxin [Myxococcales bacterium]